MENKILVITPVRHITGVSELLESIGDTTCQEHPTQKEVVDCIGNYHAIFTNPNKSNVYIGRDIIEAGTNLKVICTASTGTNHIDKEYAAKKELPVLSLTEERDVINKISSTAEHAFALTMAALRNIPQSFDSVKRGEWDYTKFIGRQFDHLTVGVIGFGRLGSKYAHYSRSLGAQVLVYDPYKIVDDQEIEQTDLDVLLTKSDVIAIHVHVTDETREMIDNTWFNRMKKDVLLINTARGDVINEAELIQFLKTNIEARLATDVVADEVTNKKNSQLIDFARHCNRIIITPHIGGMTVEGQEIAYTHAAKMLKKFLQSVNKEQCA